MLYRLKLKKIFFSRLFLLLCFVILFFLGTTTKILLKQYKLKKEIKNLKTEIQRLEGRKKELGSLKEYFQSKDFMEYEARTKLNLQKPGESLVIIPEGSQDKEERQEGLVILSQKEEKNWSKWWKYFFQIQNPKSKIQN